MKIFGLRVFGRPGENPIIRKELMARMRGGKPMITIVSYVAATVIFSYGYTGMISVNPFMDNSRLGISLFAMITMLQLGFIIFIIPSLTSNTISREKESGTLDILLTTPLSSWKIVVGKLISSIAYSSLLIIASLPALSVVFVYGGVPPGVIIKIYFVIFTVIVTYGTIGIFFSTIFKKSQTASAFSYLAVVFFLFGTLIVSALIQSYSFVPSLKLTEKQRADIRLISKSVAYLNPVIAAGSSFSGYQQEMMMGGSPFIGMTPPGGGRAVYAWKYTSASYIALTFFLLLLSAKILSSRATLVDFLLFFYVRLNPRARRR